jgi:hypothetical protein
LENLLTGGIAYLEWRLSFPDLQLCVEGTAISTRSQSIRHKSFLSFLFTFLAFRISFLFTKNQPKLHPPAVVAEINGSVTDFFLPPNAQGNL